MKLLSCAVSRGRLFKDLAGREEFSSYVFSGETGQQGFSRERARSSPVCVVGRELVLLCVVGRELVLLCIVGRELGVLLCVVGRLFKDLAGS